MEFSLHASTARSSTAEPHLALRQQALSLSIAISALLQNFCWQCWAWRGFIPI
jgi:hypothetical protein